MNTLLRQIKHDLWDQRFLFLLWVGLNVLYVFPLPRIAELENDGLHPFLLLMLARPLVWLLLLLRLVYHDAPVSDRAPWRTRPIGGATMGTAKLISAVTLIALPLLSLNVINQFRFGGAWTDVAPAWLEQAGSWTLATVLVLFTASLCRSTATLLLVAAALLGAAVTIMACGLNILRPWVMQPPTPWSVLAGLLAVLAVGATLLFIAQYRRSRPALHASAWGVLYVSGALAVGYLPTPAAAPAPPLPPGMTIELREVTALRRDEPRGVVLQGQIAVEGRPDRTLWGFHLKVPPGVRAGQPRRPFAPVYPRDEFARRFQLPPDIRPVLKYAEHRDELVFVTTNATLRRRGEPSPTTAQLAMDVEWRQLQPEPVATFDLTRLPQNSAGFRLSVITPEITKASGSWPSALISTPGRPRELDWLVVLIDSDGGAHIDSVSHVRRVRGYSVMQVPLEPELAATRLHLFHLKPGPSGRVPLRAEGIPVGSAGPRPGRPDLSPPPGATP